ncbi:MAG: hypothetical protein L0271_07490 [Gemmatimonadetes bacterium]|nr:hypothetical protein [Gemmatimonadota bacterium]
MSRLARRQSRMTGVAGLGLVAVLWTATVSAQSVSPLVMEYDQQASGRFELVNTTLFPLNVVLEPRSFDIDADGTMHYRLLDEGIDLELSAMSFRIPPGQSRFVFYRASANRLPRWFTVYAHFTGLPRHGGVDIQIELPHTVFLYGANARAAQPELVAAQIQETGGITIQVRNPGTRLNRVTGAEVQGPAGRVSLDGFPLLPGQTRTLRIESTAGPPPELVILRGDGFRIEHKLTGST